MRLVRITIFLLSLILANSTPVSAQDFTSPPTRTLLPQVSEIDLQLDAQGRPSVIARVNGKDLSLRVDLGANAFVLSEEAVEELGLPVIDFEIGEQRFPVVEVGEINVGEASFFGMSAGVVGFLGDFGDGLIGYPTFNDVLVSFDFPNEKLILQSGELPEVDHDRVVDWIGEDIGRRPDIMVSIGEFKGPAVLDTQGSGWLKLPDSLISKYEIMGPVDTIAAMGPTLGQMTLLRAQVTDTLFIGGYTVINPIIDFRDKPGVVIGSDFLTRFVVTLDQKNDRIQLLKSGSKTIEVSQKKKLSRSSNLTTDWKEYEGAYGNRNVFFENGNLYLQRNDGNTIATSLNERVSTPRLLLVQDAVDEFHLEVIPTAKVKFGRNEQGEVVELHVLNPQGTWEISTKEH